MAKWLVIFLTENLLKCHLFSRNSKRHEIAVGELLRLRDMLSFNAVNLAFKTDVIGRYIKPLD